MIIGEKAVDMMLSKAATRTIIFPVVALPDLMPERGMARLFSSSRPGWRPDLSDV